LRMKIDGKIIGGLIVIGVFALSRRSRGSTPGTIPSGGNPSGDIFSISYLGSGCQYPRGIRNNNPGNLRVSNSAWQGKIPLSENQDYSCPSQAIKKEFEQFETYVWGVRAMTKLLSNYINNGYDTISKIISRYAPSSENNTEAYIQAVSQRTGIGQNEILTSSYSDLRVLVIAMSEHENGREAINGAIFDAAYSLL